MPPRVAATFGLADFVAAEDTRVTLRLLNHLGLKKPMVSYYEHALHHGEAILNRIEAGENCALCSDAGMPCISDPGEQIVREAHERGIRVVPIPAASACVTALAASGQPTARFVFEGFLPVPKRDRRERLAFLQNETRTMIFYEAPHKLRGTLDDLAAAAIVNSFAYQAGLVATRDGIAVEKRERNPYVNIIAIRSRDKDAPWARQLVAAYQSEPVRQFILKRFQGSVIPAF